MQLTKLTFSEVYEVPCFWRNSFYDICSRYKSAFAGESLKNYQQLEYFVKLESMYIKQRMFDTLTSDGHFHFPMVDQSQ